jgi:hypothetical protein
MTDKIRCPSCRGSKKVAKLGGMIGTCNTCNGLGEINSCDKPLPINPEHTTIPSELIHAVSNCVPSSELNVNADTVTITKDINMPNVNEVKIDTVKFDPKKAIYKRKAQSK